MVSLCVRGARGRTSAALVGARACVVLAALFAQTAGPAVAQAIRCSAFLHNRDGSWTSFDEGTVLGSFGPLQIHPGERFQVGGPKAKDDVARILNSICRDE